MKTYRFEGASDSGDFSYDVNVDDGATQDEVVEEIADILETEGITPQGTVAVRPVVGTFWGEFTD